MLKAKINLCLTINDDFFYFSILFDFLSTFVLVTLTAQFYRLVIISKLFFHLYALSIFQSFRWQSHPATYERSHALILATTTLEFLKFHQLVSLLCFVTFLEILNSWNEIQKWSNVSHFIDIFRISHLSRPTATCSISIGHSGSHLVCIYYWTKY